MEGLTSVAIDFKTSHLLFPKLIAVILLLLGLAIIAKRWREIAGSASYWRDTVDRMDKPRLIGVLGLVVAYFTLMVPVGEFWPNTGLGFLICSVPFVFVSGMLFMHDRTWPQLSIMAAVSVAAPLLVWWIFTDLFFLSLP